MSAPVLMTIVPRLSDAEAARLVDQRFGVGQTLRRKDDGRLYMLGARSRNLFWMIPLSPDEEGVMVKGVVNPRVILQDFDPWLPGAA